MTNTFQIAQTKHGQMVVLANDLYISRSLIEYGEWTETEFDLMAQVLQPGDHVIDVGANIGSLTVAFAKRIGPSGIVYAFEPQPRIFQVLSTNCVLNNAVNARLFNAACGPDDGMLEIIEMAYDTPLNYGAVKLDELASAAASANITNPGQALSRNVPILKLDDVYQHKTLKLMKIDVEGMETQVLAGASRIIKELRPAMYIENEFADKSPELVKAVFDLGYDAYWHLAPCFNPDNFKGRKDDIFGGVACVNMLCVPRDKSGTIDGMTKINSVDEHPRKAA
jgi:FkbM family methyltransferase